jgi:hypothetical protein
MWLMPDSIAVRPGRPIYFAVPSPTIDLTAGPQSLDVSNISADLATQDDLTALSLLTATLSGPEANLFSLSNFTTDTILFEQQSTDLDLSVLDPSSLAPGTYSAILTIQTDQSADFASPGQSFSYDVTFTAVPEPTSIAMLFPGGFVLLGRRTSKR